MALNTRIVLKNDELSAWEGSSLVLKKGEIALAKRTNGSYDLRVGDGVHEWKDLSNSFALSAAQVIGLESTITSLSTSFYEKGTYEELTALTGVTNGSIGVVKETVVTDDGTVSTDIRTGYVYDSETGKWQQLNGNYKADQVYFTDDMTITYKFGKYDIPDTGSKVLSCKGVSVQDFLKDALAETKNPTVADPAITLTTTATLSGEVGSTYKVPAATMKVTSVGDYGYGPATGITVPAASATISCVTEGTTQSNAAALGLNNTFSLAQGTEDKTYTDAAVTYTFQCAATYTDGSVPKNNVGAEVASLQIKSATLTKSNVTATATGKRFAFYGTKTAATLVADVKTMTSAQVRALGASSNGAPSFTAGSPLTVPAGTKQIIFALPHSYGKTKISVADITDPDAKFGISFQTEASAVDVYGATETTSTAKYDIFHVEFDGAYSDAGKLTVSFS